MLRAAGLYRLRMVPAIEPETVVEDIRREVFAQAGAVQDYAVAVVDEGNAVDAIIFITPQYEVDALRGEFPAEVGFCPGALHGG